MVKIKGFEKNLLKARRIGVDSNIFIYMFEQHPDFHPLCSTIFELLSRKKIHPITSSLSVSEILVRPLEKKDIPLLKIYEEIFETLPSFSLVSIDINVAKIAAQLRAQYRITLPDAIQIAATLYEHGKVFITNDLRLKCVQDINILCLKDYV